MAKKPVAAKSAKKASAPKPAKVAKPKKSSAKFKSFSITAVIPVMSYGNIQPRIEVEAASYEEARDFAMPLIGQLFSQYSEAKPTFLGKIEETTRVVKAVADGPISKGDLVKEAPKAPEAPQAQDTPAPVAQDVPAPQATAQAVPEGAKPPAVVKAEKAIAAADASTILGVQDQIEKSVKIPEEWKPFLITLVLNKRNALK